MTVGFLIAVVFYTEVKSIFWGGGVQIDNGYTSRKLLFAILGESIRAYITSWLYLSHKTDKSLVINAIKFGIICSALIGSIWLVLGMKFFDIQDKLSFLIDDGIILILQGLIAGILLWFIFKNEKYTT